MNNIEVTLDCGCVFHGVSWKSKSPIANVVIFEGMEEHVTRYEKFALFLNEHGYDVYAIDTYGQGLNVKEDFSNVGLWPKNGFNKQLKAYDKLVTNLEDTKLPTYLFAHSMGSFMAQRYLEMFPGHISKVVLCGSGAKNGAIPIAITLAKMLVKEENADDKATTLNKLMFGNFNKKIKNPGTPFDWLSYNQQNVETYINDPLCGFGPRNRFCVEFLHMMKDTYVAKNLQKVDKNTQIFIITGDADPVTNYSKATVKLQKMYHGLGVKNVSTKVYPDMRHEILNEDKWQDVASDVVSFFK